MRALTLMDHDLQATSGGLYSSSIRPSLENRLLVQASSVLPPAPSMLSSSWASQPSSCPSLQPSSLSSTTSTLLSPSASTTSTFASPLLSTQNTLLKRDPLLFPLTSVPSPLLCGPLLSTSLTLSSGVLPPACFHQSPTLLAVEETRGGGGDGGEGGDGGDRGDGAEGGRPCSSEDMQTYSEEMSVGSEQDFLMVDDMAVDHEKPEQTMTNREEVFGEMEQRKDEEEELKDKKYLLLNDVCCSLVNKNTAPGQKDWDADESVWTRIKSLANDIVTKDPQFLLKVAVYTRQELNIRITANFLLALAASLPASKPHVRRYFCAAVQLPSDWLEVVRLYSTCFSHSLPSCLKKALADKFKQFSEYQLAKYNTRKHRCKHNKTRPKAKKPSTEQLAKWANMLRSEPTMLQKYMEGKAVVDKKQSEFSMKKMIKRLHIKGPAKHVMAILGMRYPADMKAFTRSGLSGVWERERAGQRMKLKQPETWERKLSQEGNKALTWEKLIDNKSLPFMAMLRNLRNMITQGISEKHHQQILGRLTNEKAVIQSRQFPFRFLSAYKVIMELGSTFGASEKAVPTSKEILMAFLKKLPKSKRYSRLDWETAGRKRLRVALGVPFIYRIYNIKKSLLQKTRDGQRLYTAGLLERYRKALETAVQISCRYNVPPLPGCTLMFLDCRMDFNETWTNAPDFCCPPDPEAEEGEEKEKKKEEKKKEKNDLSPTMLEAGVLLSLMIAFSAEDPHLNLLNWRQYSEVKLSSDVLLDNVRPVMKQMQENVQSCINMKSVSSLFSKVMSQKNKVDNIILIADFYIYDSIEKAIDRYRKETNNNPLVVRIYLSDRSSRAEKTVGRNYVTLTGFSEQILRFVAERGSSRLLDRVEHMDKLHHIPPPQGGAKDPNTAAAVTPLPPSPKLRWRGVRVFISSTFRDMHAERDMLVRSVFPELRRRAAPHCLYLQEVELRWGVTEEESSRTVELCLSEVCRSQMLLGILGERYGLVPSRPPLPDLPQYSWLDSAPSGLSVTEMEIRQFQALYPDMAHNRMFFYFRAPDLSRSVPVSWKSDFAPESKEAESKMSDLKSRIRNSGVKVTENYPCEWGGVVDGKPYVKGLEEFGKAVLEDLWQAMQKQFVEEADETDVGSDISEQEVHQGALQRQFFGRAKVLFGAVGKVQETQLKGGLVLLEGAPGEGKTVFMAALANALRTPDKTWKTPTCHVISYSTAASQSARTVENLLRCLVQWLRRRKEEEEDSPLPSSSKDLLAEFHSNLSDTRKDQPLALLIDGAELVQDSRGQLSSDWIPQQLPQGVSLVLSITSGSDLLQTLAKKKGAVLMPLGPLSLPDRKDIVQKELDVYGKKLSDSAFNNQLQTLLMKKGAVSPLYLHLACEDLRNFASFDKIRESLQALPQSLCELVLCSLRRLESQYGQDYMLGTVTTLIFSRTDLRERDLYAILNMWMDLTSRDEVTWQDVLHLARKPKRCIPMATFTHMVQNLQSLIGLSHCHGPDDLLALTNPEVRRGFEYFVHLPELMRVKAHLLIAAHLWVQSDPQGTDTFLHCEANSIKHLPFHLTVSGQGATVRLLLSNYHFLFANVRHGLLHHILETYGVYSKQSEFVEPAAGAQGCWEDCRSFLQRHAALLSTWPALFVQQALNEPQDTPAHAWAQGLRGTGQARLVKWLNSAKHTQRETSELVSTFLSEPTCVTVSPGGDMMVVGTGEGTLHLIHTETGQEAMSLVSSCDGVSGCLFLGESLLGTVSFDGRIEMWDIQSGCRTSLIEAHSNRITGCDVSADGKHLATVSLDSNVKVWSSPKGSLVATLLIPSPLNCVTFDPEGQLLAAGCWDGAVRVWNWLQDEVVMTLTGHQRSVRCLSFSPSSSLLCSGCVSGEVRLWSVPASTCVGRYQAHDGSTEVLSFLEEGELLVSAGSDHKVKLWSGGIGRSVNVFGNEKETPREGQRSTATVPPALCVAVAGDMAAVGYHGDGVKLFSLESGELTWASEDLRVSIPCLMWLAAEEGEEPELLVSGGGDQRLRVWGRSQDRVGGAMELRGRFGVQHGPILALAQNSSYLASASDDCTIALWSTKDMTSEPWVDPYVVSVLRGHSGGVTCLAFSPSGEELLSGGKDQALLVWNISTSPPALSKSLPHCHGDWVTGCVWTPNCVLSCSSDCKIRLWDLQTGRSVREILGRSPLSSVCCLGEFVTAGCVEGSLHIWKWESGLEISRISAHKSRIHHCSVLPSSDKTKEGIQDDMMVATASDDGTVKLWNPFQVHHHSTLQDHSGGIHGAVFKQEGDPAFLTVSEDRSLRSWSVAMGMESPPNQAGTVTALCFSQAGDLLVSGYESGCVQIWQHNSMVGHKQASDSSITAVCSMPDDQWAVACMGPSVSVWRLEWNPQHSSASLVKVSTHSVELPVMHMNFCSVLMGVGDDGNVVKIIKDDGDSSWYRWSTDSHILGIMRNDEKSTWLVAENEGQVVLGFMFAMGQKSTITLSTMTLDKDQPEGQGGWVTATAVEGEFVVCGDSKGNMWFNKPPDLTSWSSRKPAHSDRITVLRLAGSTIISASHDRTVKLWDRNTKKQVGLFVCGAPVLLLEVNPQCSSELVCCDGLGQIYFLSLRE